MRNHDDDFYALFFGYWWEMIFQLVRQMHLLLTYFHVNSFSMKILPFFSFREISRSLYAVELQADHDIVSVNVPENVTEDVAGNKNLASNVLQVRHCKDSYSFLLCQLNCITTSKA
jgi:hypothetical protein